MRGNPQYGRPTLGVPPRIWENTDMGQTNADVGRNPKARGNPQYGRPTPGGLTHGRRNNSPGVGQGGGGGCTHMCVVANAGGDGGWGSTRGHAAVDSDGGGGRIHTGCREQWGRHT